MLRNKCLSSILAHEYQSKEACTLQVTETFLLGEAVELTFRFGAGLENAHVHMDRCPDAKS